MIILIFVYLSVITLWVIKSKTNLQPWEVKSNIHWLPLSLSIVAGLVGGNTFVTFAGFSYIYGSAALVYFGGVFLGLLLFHIFNKKIRGMKNESIGAALVYDNYPVSTQHIFLAANLVRFLSVSLIQVIAGSVLLSKISNIPYFLCAIIIVGSIVVYTYHHGFSGVIKTDVVQMIMILLPLLAVCLYYLTNRNDLIHMNTTNITYQNFSFSKGLLFGLFGFLLVTGSLDIWQRFTKISSHSDSSKSLIVSIISLGVSGLGIYVISLLTHYYFSGGIDPDTVFVHIFSENVLPKYLNYLLIIATLSAILSTADTFMHGSAILLIKIINRGGNMSPNDAHLYRIFIVALGVVLIVVASLYSNILSIAIFLANIVFAFSPFLFLLTLGLKPNYRMANMGLVLSSIFAFFVGLVPNVKIEYSYGTLFISVLFMTIGLAIKGKQQEEQYTEQ